MATESLIAGLEATVHRVLERLGRDLRDLGLSQGEINALVQLGDGHPRAVAELQRATGQRASTLTGILDRLEKRDLVKRDLNPRDRRSFTVVVTREGATAARRIERAFASLEQEVLDAVPRSAANGFFAVLTALGEVAESG